MKSISKLLPALGLVFGATLAMAMNVPTMVAEKTATKVWTPDPDEEYEETNGYRDVTDMPYDCISGGPECVVQFENDDPYGDIESLVPGTFTEL